MKISIITPVYNKQETICDAIESVLLQKHTDWEYIVIDGGSTDGTVEAIKSYGEKIGIVVSEQDRGIYDAMNKGIALAQGDIIGILNADDFYADSLVFKNIVNEFSSKDIDAVFGDLDYVSSRDISKIVRKWHSSDYIPGSFSKGWHPPHPTFFVKKDIYHRYGNFDESFHLSADFELMLRFFEVHHISTSYISHVLVKMRTGGASNRSIRRILEEHKYIHRAFKKHNIPVGLLYTPKRLFSKILQYY